MEASAKADHPSSFAWPLNRSDAARTIFDSLGIPRQRNTQVSIAYVKPTMA